MLNSLSDEEAACAGDGWTWKLLGELSGFDKEAQEAKVTFLWRT